MAMDEGVPGDTGLAAAEATALAARQEREYLVLRQRARAKAVRSGLVIGVLVVVALAIGGSWFAVACFAAFGALAISYNYRHHGGKGGWKRIPPSSLAVTNGADPTFLVNQRSDASVDPSGRTFSAGTKEPTPEMRATMRGSFWDGLGGLAIELVVIVLVVVGLLWIYYR